MQNVAIGDPCWLPAFDVKLRDMSKCVCPMRAYKSVTVTCSEEGAFDVVHASSSSSTHQMGRLMSEGDGPLEYDEVRGCHLGEGGILALLWMTSSLLPLPAPHPSATFDINH